MGYRRRANIYEEFKMNNKGIALITVLVMSTVMIFIAGTIYFTLIKGTRIAGEVVSYTNVQEAAAGGINTVIDYIDYALADYSEIDNPVKGGKFVDGTGCVGDYTSLIEYLNGQPTGCSLEFRSKRGNYQLITTITKSYMGALAGAGGAPVFPPTKSNVPRYEYKFNISSRAVETKTEESILTESFYKALVY